MALHTPQETSGVFDECHDRNIVVFMPEVAVSKLMQGDAICIDAVRYSWPAEPKLSHAKCSPLTPLDWLVTVDVLEADIPVFRVGTVLDHQPLEGEIANMMSDSQTTRNMYVSGVFVRN